MAEEKKIDMDDGKLMEPGCGSYAFDKIIRVTKNVAILKKAWKENGLDEGYNLNAYCGAVGKVIHVASQDDCIQVRWTNGDILWLPCTACFIEKDSVELTGPFNMKKPFSKFILDENADKKISEYFPLFSTSDNYNEARAIYFKTINLLEQNFDTSQDKSIKHHILRYLDKDPDSTNFSALFHQCPPPIFLDEFDRYGLTRREGDIYKILLKRRYINPKNKEDFYPLTFLGTISFFHELMHWLGYVHRKHHVYNKAPKSVKNEAGYYFELLSTNGLWGLSFAEFGDGMVEYLTYYSIDPACPDLSSHLRGNYQKSYVVSKEFAYKFMDEYNGDYLFWGIIDQYIRKPIIKEFTTVQRAKEPVQKNMWSAEPRCGKDT